MLLATQALLQTPSLHAALQAAAATARMAAGTQDDAVCFRLTALGQLLQQHSAGTELEEKEVLELCMLLLADEDAAVLQSSVSQLQALTSPDTSVGALSTAAAEVLPVFAAAVGPWLDSKEAEVLSVLQNQLLPQAAAVAGPLTATTPQQLGNKVQAVLELLATVQELQQQAGPSDSSSDSQSQQQEELWQLLRLCTLLHLPHTGLQRLCIMGGVSAFSRHHQQSSTGAADGAGQAADAAGATSSSAVAPSEAAAAGAGEMPSDGTAAALQSSAQPAAGAQASDSSMAGAVSTDRQSAAAGQAALATSNSSSTQEQAQVDPEHSVGAAQQAPAATAAVTAAAAAAPPGSTPVSSAQSTPAGSSSSSCSGTDGAGVAGSSPDQDSLAAAAAAQPDAAAALAADGEPASAPSDKADHMRDSSTQGGTGAQHSSTAGQSAAGSSPRGSSSAPAQGSSAAPGASGNTGGAGTMASSSSTTQQADAVVDAGVHAGPAAAAGLHNTFAAEAPSDASSGNHAAPANSSGGATPAADNAASGSRDPDAHTSASDQERSSTTPALPLGSNTAAGSQAAATGTADQDSNSTTPAAQPGSNSTAGSRTAVTAAPGGDRSSTTPAAPAANSSAAGGTVGDTAAGSSGPPSNTADGASSTAAGDSSTGSEDCKGGGAGASGSPGVMGAGAAGAPVNGSSNSAAAAAASANGGSNSAAGLSDSSSQDSGPQGGAGSRSDGVGSGSSVQAAAGEAAGAGNSHDAAGHLASMDSTSSSATQAAHNDNHGGASPPGPPAPGGQQSSSTTAAAAGSQANGAAASNGAAAGADGAPGCADGSGAGGSNPSTGNGAAGSNGAPGPSSSSAGMPGATGSSSGTGAGTGAGPGNSLGAGADAGGGSVSGAGAGSGQGSSSGAGAGAGSGPGAGAGTSSSHSVSPTSQSNIPNNGSGTPTGADGGGSGAHHASAVPHAPIAEPSAAAAAASQLMAAIADMTRAANNAAGGGKQALRAQAGAGHASTAQGKAISQAAAAPFLGGLAAMAVQAAAASALAAASDAAGTGADAGTTPPAGDAGQGRTPSTGDIQGASPNSSRRSAVHDISPQASAVQPSAVDASAVKAGSATALSGTQPDDGATSNTQSADIMRTSSSSSSSRAHTGGRQAVPASKSAAPSTPDDANGGGSSSSKGPTIQRRGHGATAADGTEHQQTPEPVQPPLSQQAPATERRRLVAKARKKNASHENGSSTNSNKEAKAGSSTAGQSSAALEAAVRAKHAATEACVSTNPAAIAPAAEAAAGSSTSSRDASSVSRQASDKAKATAAAADAAATGTADTAPASAAADAGDISSGGSSSTLPAEQEQLLVQQVELGLQQCHSSMKTGLSKMMQPDGSGFAGPGDSDGQTLVVQALPDVKAAAQAWSAGFYSASRLIQGQSKHPVAVNAGMMVEQGIKLLQMMAAMRLQAGIMEPGVAEALFDEQADIMQLLAALPTERLPRDIQEQLAALGVGQARQERLAAEDFELPGVGLEETGLLAGATGSDLADLAQHLDGSRDLAYVLEHREEMAAAASSAGDDLGAELLSSSSSKAVRMDADAVADTAGPDHLLQLDQEIELLPGSSDAAAAAAGTDGGQPASGSAVSAKSGYGGLQLQPGAVGGGKVSVLSQLKSNRQSMLPPSNKALGKNMNVKPNLQLSAPSPEYAMAQSALAKINISPQLKQQYLGQTSLTELYSQAGTTRRQKHREQKPGDVAGAAAASQAAALAAAREQMTYQKLVASKPMQRACALVTQQLRNFTEVLYKNSSGSQQHSFEVALLIDNSGSMVRLVDETKQAMVLVAEVLRRLEVKFALVRFGRAHGQVILKGLHQPFSAQVMQLALESLTFDEGTYPASACGFVANTVFADAPIIRGGGSSSSDDVAGEGGIIHHRLVLALVDGLTQEMRAEDYNTALQPKGIKLAVLNLYNKQQEELMESINNLWDVAADFVETLNKDHVEEMPRVVAQLITAWFDQELKQVVAAAAPTPAAKQGHSQSQAPAAASAGEAPSSSRAGHHTAAMLQAPVLGEKPFLLEELRKGLGGVGSITYNQAAQQGGSMPGTMFRHSLHGAPIPLLQAAADAEQRQLSAPQGSSSASKGIPSSMLEQQVEEAQAALGEYHASLSHGQLHAAALADVQQLWQQALAKPAVKAQVERLVQVLEGEVLPHNKHTRRRAAESGPSLHMPGLLRAVSSNYTELKIFARKAGGGKRQHQVALLLDVSESMQGHLLQCGLEALMVMAEALGQVGIDDFSVITFGSAAVLIKGPDTPWDAASQMALLEQINCRKENRLASMDAAAIRAAAALLQSNHARTERKMFVITDGCGTSGLALASALNQAEQDNVQVVGLAVGFDRTHVPACYQHWAAAALPATLPDALQALYAAEEAGGAGSSAAAAADEDWSVLMPVMAGAASSVQEVLSQQRSVFGDLVQQLSRHKEAKLIHAEPDDMSVDVCFCIDVTGSMSGWIEACKAQITTICDGLLPKISKKCPDVEVKVRWSLVAYRDQGDTDQLQELDFTEDPKELIAKVKTLTAQGGGDEAEDIMAALQAASHLSWTSKARFLVLIADAPAHGRDCNDLATDSFPAGSPRPGCGVRDVMLALRKQQVDLMLMPVKEHKLDKTAAAMRAHYDRPAEDRKLTCEPLFDSSKQPASAFHFVFCLDGSGSMSGTPWAQLMTAYQQLLHRRNNDQCLGDVVSVVTFNSSPRVVETCTPIESVRTSFSGGSGGTAFGPALRQCDSLLASTPPGFTPILVFMSDGEDGAGDAVQEMQSLYNRYSSRNLQVHTIAFGAAAYSSSSYSGRSGAPLLQNMAQAAAGQFHTAASGVQLSQVFVQIAAECGAVDGLVKRFSEILSDMITVKVMVDYL